MVTLNKPAIGNTNWGTDVNANWTTIENSFEAAMYGLFQGYMSLVSTTQIKLAADWGIRVDVNGELVDISTALTCNTTDNLLSSSGTNSGGAMAASTLYYVYVSNSSASYQPSSLRASATAPTAFRGDNYLAATGNGANWRLVGWVRTDGSTHFIDSITQRWVINAHNKRVLPLFSCPGYDNTDGGQTTYTTTSTTYTTANGGTGSQISFLSNGVDAVDYGFVLVGRHTTVGERVTGGVGEDSQTSAAISSFHACPVASQSETISGHNRKVFSAGYHTLDLLVQTTAATATIFADLGRNGSTADPPATTIFAHVMG